MSERELCPASVPTRPDDLQRYGAMPTGTNDVPPVMPCAFQPGHLGPHVYGIQEEMRAAPGPEGEPLAVYWWATWGDGHPGPYTISVMDACPESYGYDAALGEQGLCCLPLGHEGPHAG